MPKPARVTPIGAFQPIDGLRESTQLDGKLVQATNVLLRPLGGFKGIPKYDRLWNTGSSETMQAFYRRQTFTGYPSGVGVDSNARQANKTCAYLIKRQGKCVVVLYDLVNDKCRGKFYLGDDGSYTSGSYDFTAGTPTVTVLAVGLDSDARWYGQRIFNAVHLGNGVDDNVICQIHRNTTPGVWRKAASNVSPGAPKISLVEPASSGNVQSFWTIPAGDRTGGQSLTFTAKVGLFPGLSGNHKIRVRISNTAAGAALRSSLTGQGTTADPYFYTLVAGTTSANSSNTSLVTFVNQDSRVNAILEASTSAADNTADLGNYGPTDLDGGTGTGNSEGYSNRTITFYARYWDPGAENMGYEGVSSAISNEVIIPKTANNDIRVLVPVDSTAEGGRFPFIRLYMQFDEAPNAAWLLINPDDPVPNGNTGTLSRIGSTDMVLLTGQGWSANDVVRLTTTGTLPGGLSTGTDYYLQLRAQSGSLTRLSGTNAVVLGGSGWANGDGVRLTTTDTLPAPLTTGKDYYLETRTATGTFVRHSSQDITLGGGPWKTDDKVRLTTTGTLPGGLSTGTDYYIVDMGGGVFRLSLSPGGGGSGNIPLSNDGTGTHTMTLQTMPGQYFLSQTQGGAVEVLTSDGSGTHTATLSAVSGQWALATAADGTPVSLSTSGTGTHTATLTQKCVQVGTQTPFLPAADGGEMFMDQNRPLPHTLIAYSNEQVWRAGVTDFPERIYPSKPATSDEVVPEGCNLEDLSFISVLNQSESGGTNKMTALVSSQNRIDCHYPTGITMFDPTNTDARNFTATGAGAINPTAVTTWEGRGQYFLGGDLQLRSQNVEQTGAGFAATVAGSQFEALTASLYMRNLVDLAELARNPHRVFLFSNKTDQHLYMSLPAKDGTLRMFGYDMLAGGIVGPFDYPKVYAACMMEPDRPEILFSDEAGNLFVWDTAAQNDHGDTFGTVSAFTPHSTGTPMPSQYNGYGYVDVNGQRYYQAYTSVLETGYLDLNGTAERKAVIALLFRVVLSSRALVTATVTALGGDTTTLSFSEAEMAGEVEHRLNVFLSRTTSVKIKFEVVGAEQKPWVIRDLTVLWKSQGSV